MKKFIHSEQVENIGSFFTNLFHLLALFVIGATIVWAAAFAYLDMMSDGYASLKDILLLFIYLELGAMVSIYFKTKKLPVEFLIYIAITALTRVITVDIKTMESDAVIAIVAAILLLTLSILVLNYSRKISVNKEDQSDF